MKRKYGKEIRQWSKRSLAALASIEAYVGQSGISLKSMAKSPDDIFRIVRYLYEVEVNPLLSFEDKLLETQSAIKAISKSRRRSLQEISKMRFFSLGKALFLREALSGAICSVAASESRHRAYAQLAAYDSAVSSVRVLIDYPSKKKEGVKPAGPSKNGSKRNTRPTDSAKGAFYKSWEWKRARYKVLKEYGPRCMLCGAERGDIGSDGDPVKICVDHIKPISRYWHLRLEQTNLQILCNECNMGKGAWDQSDWRADNENAICEYENDGVSDGVKEQMRYHI